jgi:hypothetical protein
MLRARFAGGALTALEDRLVRRAAVRRVLEREQSLLLKPVSSA